MKRIFTVLPVVLIVLLLLQLSVAAKFESAAVYQLQEQRDQNVRVAINGSYAYVASGASCFSVVNIHDPAHMQRIAHLDFTEAFTDIQVSGGLVYMTSLKNLYVLDISRPLHPVYQSQIAVQTDEHLLGFATDSNRMYLFDKNNIFIYSLEDPARPALIKSFCVNDAADFTGITDIAVRNGIAYVAMGYKGAVIYDLNDPNAITCKGTCSDVEGYYTNVDFYNQLAFIRIAESNRIEVINISDILHPQYIKTLYEISTALTGGAMGLADHFVLLADNENKIHVVDVSDISDIKQTGLINTTASPVYIHCEGSLVYAVDQFGGMNIVGNNPPAIKAEVSPSPQKTEQIIKAEASPLPQKKNQKTAYITIDDGPSRNNTPKNLDTLKKYGVKATFFVLPKKHMDDIYKRMINEGHVIGNHSYGHDANWFGSPDNFKKDTLKARDYIFNKFKYTSKVYRFPGGTMGHKKTSIKARTEILSGLRYRYFDWDVSTADTDPNLRKYGNEEYIVNLLANNVINGAKGRDKLIILMHDSSGKTYTAKALPKIIEGLQKKGYVFDVLTNY